MNTIYYFSEKEIYDYIDSLIIINEKFNFDDVKNKCVKVLNKIKNLPAISKKRVLIYFITSLLSTTNTSNAIKAIYSTNDPDAIEVIDQKLRFHDPQFMTISEKGKENIKNEEKLKLKAYTIGDGMISIGWGHAERIGSSKFKKDDIITKEIADQLFNRDIEIVESSIKRMFINWNKKGIKRKVTQDQFDALVSMAYNMGAGGLRKSQVVQHIKVGDYEKAGKQILSTNISDDFPGLEKRRIRESKMFLSYLG